MPNWQLYFKQPTTEHDFYQYLLYEQGYSYSEAYHAVYGEYPCDTPREFAEHLHKQGKSIRTIAGYCQLRFGVGSKSVVHRWLNPDAMARHLERKRKSP